MKYTSLYHFHFYRECIRSQEQCGYECDVAMRGQSSPTATDEYFFFNKPQFSVYFFVLHRLYFSFLFSHHHFSTSGEGKLVHSLNESPNSNIIRVKCSTTFISKIRFRLALDNTTYKTLLTAYKYQFRMLWVDQGFEAITFHNRITSYRHNNYLFHSAQFIWIPIVIVLDIESPFERQQDTFTSAVVLWFSNHITEIRLEFLSWS